VFFCEASGNGSTSYKYADIIRITQKCFMNPSHGIEHKFL